MFECSSAGGRLIEVNTSDVNSKASHKGSERLSAVYNNIAALVQGRLSVLRKSMDGGLSVLCGSHLSPVQQGCVILITCSST